MKKRQTVTLKHIAEALNLSISTVSRSLKNHKDISKETIALVHAKAKELNYFPNIFAQGFRKHRTHLIGVVVPNLTHYYSSTILEAILEEAEKKGYHVIITGSKDSYDKQIELLNTMLHLGVDGILLSLTRDTYNVDKIIKYIEQVPLILFDKVSRKVPCTQVIIDDEQAAFNAVKHLIDTGRKRIAIFKETNDSFNSLKRYEGYLRALKTNNLPFDESLVYSSKYIPLEQGRKLAETVLKNPQRPDAVFCITDNCAVGAMQVFKKNNIKIPEEIAIVGFSNSLASRIVNPNLTTVDQPGSKVGKTAINYLIDEIDNPKENYMDYKTVEIKTNLIVRESSIKND
ncbi:LacI family transcriptional regulator [Wenyingzhuangia heitensis]|uniref:LacI family transcriptional regulator n=1 Tax=Wenyingzhuangia heitensis TaxID=1487859 RepID=A0ABX0U8D4_9FLAO|nr:LacI family DNA-binding transcriptional regulator [Wenyingzhuangia heitensis]NIJ45087.1 LacI family transcriptional regulator [Wenyingzhuangia heitensis]